jgi:hypothetical protein
MKAVKPEIVKPSKPKFMLSGKSGAGKTFFALNFPKPYLIDTEGGATREQYTEKLIKVGGSYMGKDQGSQDFKTVLEEVKELATTKHDFKTLIIDSYSKLYNIAAAIAEEKIGSEFGRDKKEANKPSRQLLRWIDRIDMTVILVCHTKDKWERRGNEVTCVGTTFDGFDKFEYDLDLWLEVQKVGRERSYFIKKSRIDSFPEGGDFPLDYADFSKRYGKEIVEGESKPLTLAAPDQVAKAKHLTELLKIEPEVIEKWFAKDEADDWSDMSSDNIQKVIVFLEKKIKGDSTKEAA